VDYAEAVRLLPDPRPDHYLEWARARAPEGPLAARAALDEGVRRLGPVVSLMLPALDQEVAAGRLDDALARIDRLAAAAPRADGWATLRGELLARAGRCDEARAAFREALRSLEAQPPPRRAARGNAELERRARAALEASDAAR
jgi:predicted Zn-dependent protease